MPTPPSPTLTDLRAVCRQPYGFWLDSALPHPKLARRSLCGEEPFQVLRSWGQRIELWTRGGTHTFSGSPFEALRDLLREQRGRDGAAVGYLAYELKRFVERVPQTAADDLGLPECCLAIYERPRAFDPLPLAVRPPGPATAQPLDEEDVPPSTFTRRGYEAAIERVLAYIRAGDIYQANLSQRFQQPLEGDPFDAYLSLRERNPAPFAAYLSYPEAQVLSSSPERFLRVDGTSRRVETRPIKGTRPRGRTPDEDERLARELLASEKDRAENVMIVDLERNDLGRVAEIGSVRVRELAALETFPAVFHLTSTIEATLRPDVDLVDLLLAAFPGGSITGAPKIRAMEIIDQLEPTARSVYTGAIGYLGFDGSLDLNIAIRTIIARDGVAYFQAGGGIVADSDPAEEYRETLHKARALWESLAARPAAARR